MSDKKDSEISTTGCYVDLGGTEYYKKNGIRLYRAAPEMYDWFVTQKELSVIDVHDTYLPFRTGDISLIMWPKVYFKDRGLALIFILKFGGVMQGIAARTEASIKKYTDTLRPQDD